MQRFVALDDANKDLKFELTIDDGSCVTDFGSKADEICMSAVERFSSEAPYRMTTG